MRRVHLMLLLCPLLVASKCKDKKAKDLDDIEDISDGSEGDNVIDVDAVLALVSIQPAVIEPAQVVDATVIGAGFAEGATVKVDGTTIDRVVFGDESSLEIRIPPKSPGSYDVEVINPDGESSVLFKGLTVQEPSVDECHHIRVFYALDKAELVAEAKALLEAKLACLQTATGQISIEGHADERGTTDYNIALGQRRADSLQTWMSTRGVAPSRVQTVSYGEEKPLVDAHEEAAWSQNRRGEIKLSQ
jgi:peptidoglycan-associated lipoprotein